MKKTRVVAPPESRYRKNTPPAELHIEGQRFVIEGSSFFVFAFEHGAGMMVREGMPEDAALVNFLGARVFGSTEPTVLAIAIGADAMRIIKAVRATRDN